MLVLKNLIDDKYAEKQRRDQFNAEIEANLLKQAELNKQVQCAVANEELSRFNADAGRGESLLQSFVDPFMG